MAYANTQATLSQGKSAAAPASGRKRRRIPTAPRLLQHRTSHHDRPWTPIALPRAPWNARLGLSARRMPPWNGTTRPPCSSGWRFRTGWRKRLKPRAYLRPGRSPVCWPMPCVVLRQTGFWQVPGAHRVFRESPCQCGRFRQKWTPSAKAGNSRDPADALSACASSSIPMS